MSNGIKQIVLAIMFGFCTCSMAAPSYAIKPAHAAMEESLEYFRSYPLATRGYELMKAGKSEEAIPWFERAVNILPQEINWRLQLIDLLLQHNELNKAKQLVIEGLNRHPEHKELATYQEQVDSRIALAAKQVETLVADAEPQLQREQSMPQFAAPAISEAMPEKAAKQLRKVRVYREDAGAKHYYEALDLQKQERFEEAIKALERAVQASPDNYLFAVSLGYAYRMFERKEAIPHFRYALENPEYDHVREDFVYALEEEGYRQEAGENLRLVVPQETDADRRYDLRRKVQILEDNWVSYASATYRDGLARGSGIPGIQNFTDSLQYGFETIYSPDRWQRHKRRFQLYGQAFASSDNGQRNLNDQSTQGAVGVRAAPVPDEEWFLYLARLFPIGDNAIHDWQLRTTYAITEGFDIDPNRIAWPYLFLTPDISYLTRREELFASFEGRYGYSFRYGDWVATPHIVTAAAHQDNPNSNSDSVELGLGLSVKYWFDESATHAPRGSVELIFQWRDPVAGSSTDISGPFVRLVTQY
ncbi:MAG: tetratricopeptide repeat protein [Rickettsiales bacterium]|nr:tetratricopeptide repeat protein [Rickettsiales bacterium]